MLLCTRQSKEAPTSPPVVPLPPPMPPTMPPKYTRGKPLPPRASTEPARLQEIHGNSLFLAKQRGSYATDMEGQEEAGEEEEGLLVLENDEEGNDYSALKIKADAVDQLSKHQMQSFLYCVFRCIDLTNCNHNQNWIQWLLDIFCSDGS